MAPVPQFNHETIDHVDQHFDKMDVDKSGLLSADELVTYFYDDATLTDAQKKETKELIENFDTSVDGKLSYREFVRFMATVYQQSATK